MSCFHRVTRVVTHVFGGNAHAKWRKWVQGPIFFHFAWHRQPRFVEHAKWSRCVRVEKSPDTARIVKRAFQIQKERVEKPEVDARMEKRAFQIQKERVEKPQVIRCQNRKTRLPNSKRASWKPPDEKECSFSILKLVKRAYVNYFSCKSCEMLILFQFEFGQQHSCL